MNIDVSESGLKDLIESLENASENLPREIYTALSKAGTKTKSAMAKEVAKELNVAQKVIRQQMKVHKDRHNLVVTVSLVKSERIPLRDFKARATKKKGVTAKISKTKGSKSYLNAFQVVKIGNHIFQRETEERLPIRKLHGPSPWGVMVKNPAKIVLVTEVARESILIELKKRVRFLELKKRGGLSWQQPDTEPTEGT